MQVETVVIVVVAEAVDTRLRVDIAGITVEAVTDVVVTWSTVGLAVVVTVIVEGANLRKELQNGVAMGKASKPPNILATFAQWFF